MKRIISVLMAMMVLMSVMTTVTFAEEEENLGPNVALHKKVSIGWVHPKFRETNVVDGDENTLVSTSKQEKVGELIDGENVLVIDLNAVYEINTIIVKSRRDVDQAGSRMAWFVELATQSDYSDRHVVGEKPTAGEFKSDLRIDFKEPAEGRYVMFWSTKTFAEPCEIEVYGVKYSGVKEPLYQDIDNKSYNASKMLETLGIMQGISLDEFGVNMLIRRDEAAKLISIAAKLAVPERATSSFSDVEADNKYLNYIEACLDAGIISKSDTYRPRDFVCGTEILKMLECAMGYDIVLPRLGEYPHNVLKLARDLELTKGLSGIDESDASREDVLNLIYNALLTPVTVASAYEEGIVYYENGGSLLERSFGLRYKKGVVTENDVTSLIEPVAVNKNSVKIDKVKYYDVNNSLHDFIGYSVYYLVNDNGEILGGWQDKVRQAIYTVYAKDIVFGRSSNTCIVTEDKDEKREEYIIADEAPVLKNGVAFEDFKVDELTVPSTKLSLIDNNNDGTIDVVHVFEPKVIAVSHAAKSEDGRIFIDGLNGERVVADNYRYAKIIKNSKTSNIDNIGFGSLVYAYETSNKKNYIFEVVDNSVSGKLEASTTDSIIVDGTEYDLSKYYKENIKKLPNLVLGARVSLILDEHNDVIWVSDVNFIKDSEVFAVTTVYEMPDVAANAKIKLYNANAEFLTLEVADNVRIDGTTYTQDKLRDLLEKNPKYLRDKVVLYSTNQNDQIIYMDTENHDEKKEPDSILGDGSFVSSVSQGFRVELGVYDGQKMVLPIFEDFPVLVVPTTLDRSQIRYQDDFQSEFSVSDTEALIKKVGYVNISTNSFKVFGKDEYGSPSLGIMFQAMAGSAEFAPVTVWNEKKSIVVDTVTRAKNANSELAYKIKGYNLETGEKLEITTHEDLVNVINADKLQISGDFAACSARLNLIDSAKFAQLVSDSAKRKLYVSSVADLKKGDILRYEEIRGSGRLTTLTTNLERVFTSSEHIGGEAYKTVYTAGDEYLKIRSTFRIRYGTMDSFKDNILQLAIGNEKELVSTKDVTTSSYVIEDGKITKCAMAELPMYISSGTKLALYSSAGKHLSIVAFVEK